MRLSSAVQHSDSLTGVKTAASKPQAFVPVFEVPVEGEVERELDRIYTTYRDVRKYGVEMPEDGKGKFGLLLLNMDKDALAPPNVTAALALKTRKEGTQDVDAAPTDRPALSYAYRYTYGSASGFDSFVSSKRFAVVDLAAGPSSFGSTQQGAGAVIGASIPRRHFTTWQPQPGEATGPSRLRGRSLRFQAQLAAIVHSAVAHVFVPDVQFDELDFSEKVLVPIIVFQDHRMFDPLAPGHAFSVDVEKIRTEVQRMALPGQVGARCGGRDATLCECRGGSVLGWECWRVGAAACAGSCAW